MAGKLSLVEETGFVARVRHHARLAHTCRVAVGYCGEAAYTFFPEKPGDWPQDFRVLVDASVASVQAHLTNPKGLGHLLGMGATIKCLPGLHAKVLTFDDHAALVGSVNLSAHAITSQIQLSVEMTSSTPVKAINKWFEAHWDSIEDTLDADDIAALQKHWKPWPAGAAGGGVAKPRPTPKWKGPAPEPPLPKASFTVGVSTATLREVLRRFKTTTCKYSNHNDGTCAEAAHSIANWYRGKSVEFHTLYGRRSRWNREDLEALHKLAFLNGKAAALARAEFVRQDPKQVAQKVAYLLDGDGDPYIRLERVLDARSDQAVPGFGLAAWACLLHLWNPKAFAIFNAPVLKALKALKVKAGSAKAHRKAAKYRNLSEAVKYLAKKLQLGNLSRADHFFDGLGKKHFRMPQL